VFDLTRALLSDEQRARAIEIMQRNVAQHDDWIVVINSMKVLGAWAEDDDELRTWLRPQLRRRADDPRRSVASNARTVLARLDR
jgi:hypothetical protein